MSPADRARIADLLRDDSLSFRAISRATGYSDHTIRRISRQLSNDPRPMRRDRRYQPDEAAEPTSTRAGWIVFGGIAAFVALLVWARIRWTPPESWH